MALTKIGASLSGSADVITVTQSSHGLYLGYPVKMTNSGYAHATADTAANAEAIGIVIATDRTGDNTTFTLALGGRVTVDGAVTNQAAGTVLFLQVTAGILLPVEPSGTNQVSKPMAVVTIVNSEMIMVQQRGEVITTGVIDAHTIESHTATGATGAELDTLTDGSTTALHAHAGGTTINTNADNRIITGSGTANTLNGESNLTFSTDLTITSGNVVIGTSGKGIDFSAATPDASGMTSELLDDYEEGTFTPTIMDETLDGTGESQVYGSARVARYTKIGNRVYYNITLSTTSLGSLTGGEPARIGGLPFVSVNVSHSTSAAVVGNASGLAITAGYNLTGLILPNVANMNLYRWDVATGTTPLTLAEFSADGRFDISGFYEV